MKKRFSSLLHSPGLGLTLAWIFLILLAYGGFLIHPHLHLAFPENDTWNFPVRWSTLSSLRQGHLPLWNPLCAFGVPWLASWSTEVFYPGTLLFTWLGLNAWNLSGILHLLLFSLGIYLFLRNLEVSSWGAFFSASLALLNVCALNHLGSNAPTDTMAWIPWIFIGAHEILQSKPFGKPKLTLALAFQILAGYPQIVFYTLLCLLAYVVFYFHSVKKLMIPMGIALLFTCCQWLPSLEYYLLQAVRLPAIHANPDLALPLNNLWTFLWFNALSEKGLPDYVASPTYFYFNFYMGLIPLGMFAIGVFHFKKWTRSTRFWATSLVVMGLWTFGGFIPLFHEMNLSILVFLEPAKAWVLVNFIELITLGLLWEILFSKSGRWKWIILILSISNLLVPIWIHPLERNLTPPSTSLEQAAQKIKDQLGSGRLLVLVDQKQSSDLYQPRPDPRLTPQFKYFVPNSNLYEDLPLANFYSSTCPTWGVLDTELYFKYQFPYSKGHLLDLLGVDLLLLNQSQMPKPFIKVGNLEGWTLWKNPNSLGRAFIYKGAAGQDDRVDVFTRFASNQSNPHTSLFLEKEPISEKAGHPLSPIGEEDQNHYVIAHPLSGYLVITQNAMPGWRVWVNQKPRPLWRADWLFQCVPLSPGDKTVDLSYEPTSFRLGLYISLLALAAMVFISLAFLGTRLKQPSA